VTTYEPGLYYMSRFGGEVRKLLGTSPPQADLFQDDAVLPKDRWSYKVIWSRDKKREGQTFACNAKSFKTWGCLPENQDWWRRAEAGEVRYFWPLGFWIDGGEIMVPAEENEIGTVPERRFPAQALRDFLGRR